MTMLAPSTYPTPTQVLSDLPRTGPRLSAQWTEVLNILRRVLPGVLSLANSEFGLALPNLHGFIVDGEKAPDAFPWVSVGTASGQVMPFADGFADTQGNFVVHFQFAGGCLDRAKLDALADMACLVRAVLWHFAGPHGDSEGRMFWDELLPTAITLGPTDNLNSVGIALHMRLVSYPGGNYWQEGAAEPLPDPTPQEVLDALPYCGGRLSLARAAILEICERLLAQVIRAFNVEQRLSMKAPKGFAVLGEELSKSNLPAVVVAASVQTQALGAEGMPIFADSVSATLYCLNAPTEQRYVLDDNADMAALVRSLLLSFEAGYVNAQGQSAWTELMPQSGGWAQVPASELSGATARFELFQGPDEERWAVS